MRTPHVWRLNSMIHGQEKTVTSSLYNLYITKVCGEDQLATAHIFCIEMPLNSGQDVAISLVEWACNSFGGSMFRLL